MSGTGLPTARRVLVAGVAEEPSPFLSRLFEGLRGFGHRVEVVGGLPPGLRRSLATAVAQRTHLVAPDQAEDVLRARMAAARLRPDVVYLPWNATAVAHRGLLERWPSVVSCRGSQVAVALHDPDRAAERDLTVAVLAAATLVHCVSDDMARRVTALGVDPARLRVVRPAVDLSLFAARQPRPAASPGPFRVVTVGALIWRKGNEDLMVAMALLRDRGIDVQLDVIGSGPERERVAFARDDLDLGPRVRLLGDRPPAEVARHLRAADAFALPSLSEGISNAVLEAMASRCPVVTTDVGGQAEAVTDEVDGLLVPSRDPSALADALERLARQPELRERLGSAGRRQIEQHHDLRDQVRAFSEMLDEAAALGARSRAG